MSHTKTLKPSNNISLRNDVFRPIHYLGSKLRILDFIENTINGIDPDKGKVCDLFSGSGSVSFKLSQTRPVVSVDIQEYSKVICNTLLNPIKIDKTFVDNFTNNCLNAPSTKKLYSAIAPLVGYEEECILNAINHTDVEKICEILEDGSLISFQITNKSAKTKLDILLQKTLSEFKAYNLLNKKSIAIRYFGGIYFSYKQTFQIDAILEEINRSPKQYQDLLLAALLSTASECVNTVGKQFAQPLRPRGVKGEVKPSIGKVVNKDRSLDLLDVYIKWVNRYNTIPENIFKNSVVKADFSVALNNLSDDVKVVYADPPYTREHYSRFYHVLETIALRDSPSVSTMVLKGKTLLSRGLYREERHQSPFCIRSTAPEAFEMIFSKVSAIGAKLVLSYSPYDESKGSHPRVITMTKITDMASKYYKNVKIVSPGNFVHSKLTTSSKHLEASSFAEVLIVCF